MAITFGSEYVFEEATSSNECVAALDATFFAIAYQDDGNSGAGTCIIGSVSGTEISYGSPVVFDANSEPQGITKIDSTHFAIVYEDVGDSNYGKVIIGTINGTTVTFGTAYTFITEYCNYSDVDLLDSTHLVIAYNEAVNNKVNGVIATITNDDELSFGSEYELQNDDTTYISVTALDSTHFVLGYRAGDPYYGTVAVGVVTGTAIAYGTPVAVNAFNTNNLTLGTLDSTHFVVAYGTTNQGTKIGTVASGDEITLGDAYDFGGQGANIGMSVLDSTHFVLVYRGTDNDGYANYGTVDGTSITFDGEVEFNDADTSYTDCSFIDSSKFVTAYQDIGNSNYGTAIIGTVPTGLADLKSINSITKANIKSINSIAIADVKSINTIT